MQIIGRGVNWQSQATGEASVPTLLAALTSTSIWGDADMASVVEYLRNSKYVFMDENLEDFVFSD